MSLRVCVWSVVALCVCAPVGWSDVVSYTTEERGRATVLTSVSVRHGQSTAIFDPARLIPVTVVHFKSTAVNNVVVPAGAPRPRPQQRGALLADGVLNSGLINPGGQDEPLARAPVLAGPNATPGLAVRFRDPVVNRPGDDVVLFELHRRLMSPPGGDAFLVSPLRFAPGLRSLCIERFDVDLDHPRVKPNGAFVSWRVARPVQSVAELEAAELTGAGAASTDFKALAVGIDLSDLGYAPEAKVAGLFFQDKSGRGLVFDPVFIAGLPAPEPPNVLAAEPKPKPDRLLEEFLADAATDFEEVVFAVRVCGFDHWYANFSYQSCSVAEYPPQRGVLNEKLPRRFGDGGRLCALNLRTGKLRVLLDDPKGGVRDPQVHYDGGKILFSYRRGGEEYYHLYEINTDGTGLRQITRGPFDDIEPTYLPDGGILFCSSRCKRYVNCWRTPVAVLYRCKPDGSGLHVISTNVEHDNTPWVLPDGRILYTRWEYVDRSQVDFHHLWTANPDGTGQMVFYGNQRPGTTMIDAKPVPGTSRIVASFSPGHGRGGHDGYLTVVDTGTGPDDVGAAQRVSAAMFRDPYAVSAEWFLAASRRGIHVVNASGREHRLYALPAAEAKRLQCHEPRPLRRRLRERVVPSRTDPSRPTGRLVLTDLYEGRNMAGVRRGEVRKLLVLEQLPKPINFSGGPWPISMGGTFTLARILGTVPVEADGSAYMEVPALRSLFLVALDKDDLSVKRMQSFLTVMPGETTGCVGCHEARATAPVPHRTLLAMARPPSRIEAIADVPDVMDFHRDVQPVLDRHCVRCHDPDRRDGRVDLCGDHTPLAAESYWTLLHYGLIADGRNEKYGNRPPRQIGSSASRLLTLMDGSHYKARPSAHERAVVRLWIESSAVYAGTYAALGSGMHPVEFPMQAMERRCGACHGCEAKGRRIGKGKLYFRFGKQGPHLPLVHTFLDLQRIRGSIGYYKFGNARPPQSLCNLTRPEKSLLLRAPLAKTAGGLGLCKPKVFGDATDADYQTILRSIAAASRTHHAEKRFDLPGFRPNVYYVRKMQEYGILPKTLALDAAVDGYATDRAYWRSFWYQPVSEPR